MEPHDEYMALAMQRLLPDDGIPLRRLHGRFSQGLDPTVSNRRFGGVEVVPAGQINYHTAIQEEEQNVSMSATKRREIIRGRMEALEAELHELDQFGDDKYEEDDVLLFDMKFPNTDTLFAYAALKKDGKWFITGVQNGSYKTWDELVNFWKDKVISIHKVSKLDQVFQREGVSMTRQAALEGDVIDKDVDVPVRPEV